MLDETITDVMKTIKGSNADLSGITPDPIAEAAAAKALADAAAKPTVSADDLFKQKNAAMLEQMSTLQKQLEDEKTKAKQSSDKIAEIERVSKEAERSKMTEMQRFSADIQEQQKQINVLLNENVEFKNQLSRERSENVKQKLISESGLRGEFHQFVHGSDPIEVKKQVDNLLAIQSKIKTETLDGVPAVVRQEVTGAPPAAPSGTIPTTTPAVDLSKYKEIKDFRNLGSLFHKDPVAKKLLTGR